LQCDKTIAVARGGHQRSNEIKKMYTLYSMQRSGNSYKVRLALALLKAPYRAIEIDILRGESRTPEFLAKNPSGQVPLLEVAEGRYLAESNAILWYVAIGTSLAPETRIERAEARAQRRLQARPRWLEPHEGAERVEHLAQEDTAHFVGVTDWVGRKVSFDLAANGKVFLAYGMPPPKELAYVRARGFATSIDELELGLSALAAPVFGPAGEEFAALSISGPSARLTSDRIAQLAPLLIDEALERDA